MGTKLFRVVVSAVAALAVINAFQVQPTKAFEIRIPNPVGFLMEGMGIKTYKLTTAYQKFLSPYIVNQDAYDKLVTDYGGKKPFSGKAGVNIVLKLGILRSHPKWLSSETLQEIQKFYPVREKKTEAPIHRLKLAQAENFQLSTSSDTGHVNLYLQYAEASPSNAAGVVGGAAAAELIPALQAATRTIAPALRLPPVATTAALAIAAATIFELNRDSLFKYLTPEAQALIVAAENTVCQNIEGGCSRSASPNQLGSSKDGNGKPCITLTGRIIPIGTVAFRPLDTPPRGRAQHGIEGPHYNIYKANQNPNNGKCFWVPIGAVTPNDLPSGAIPIEPFVT